MSLSGNYDPENIFARILRGQVPSAKVWEDDNILAFMDAFPQSEGHVLVIHKRAVARNLLDIEPSELAQVMAAVQRTARAVTAALEPDGFSIMQFNGESGGQTVFHLHVHIIPRWAEQPLKGHSQGVMCDLAVLNAVAARIAQKLS
jgi:histidine triad (HIT) family protein